MKVTTSPLSLLGRIVLDHHGFGYLSMWYGGATVISGLLMLWAPKRLKRFLPYLRLLHLMIGISTAFFGIITYLIAP